MLGLIIKDFLYLKNIWKNILIMFIGTIVISVTLNNYLFVISIVPLMLVTAGINTFQADEFYNTEMYTISYPLSRKEIVRAKYLFTLIAFCLGLIIGSVLYVIFNLFINSSALDSQILVELLVLLVVGLFIDFIFYPIIYKYGCEKSSFVLISIVIGLMALLSLVSSLLEKMNVIIDYVKIIAFVLENGVILFGILLILFGVVSYLLSVRIYEKLDF